MDRTGPPITFVGKSAGTAKEDPSRVRQAEESRSFMAAKELVYDAILRRATDIHLEPTTDQLSVRYRIDGILHAAEPFDRPTGDAVVNMLQSALARWTSPRSASPRTARSAPSCPGPRPRLPRRHLGVEGRREAGHANPRQFIGRDQARGPGHASQAGRAGARAWSPSPTACSFAAGRPGRASRPRSTPRLREIDRFQRNIITVEDPIEYQHRQRHPDGDQHQVRPDLRRQLCGRSCGKTPT